MAEYDGRGRSRGADPLAGFDAFRARRAAEQEADGAYEATAQVYDYGSGGDTGYTSGYGSGYPDPGAIEPTRLVADGHGRPPGGRGKLRSTAVLLAVALFAVGLAAGVYAVTRSTNTGSMAASSPNSHSASPTASASAPAGTASNGAGMAPGMGSSSMAASPDMSTDMDMGMGMGSGTDPMGTADPGMPQMPAPGANHGTLAQLAVIDVAGDSFTALTVRGATVEILITGQTQFGTPAQPFSPADLVPGAQVLARVKHASGGQYVATAITGAGGPNQPSTQMNPPAGGSGDN